MSSISLQKLIPNVQSHRGSLHLLNPLQETRHYEKYAQSLSSLREPIPFSRHRSQPNCPTSADNYFSSFSFPKKNLRND